MLLRKGSYQKNIGVSCLYGVSQPSVSRNFHHIVGLIVSHVMPNEIQFPTTNEEFQSKVAGFRDRYDGTMPEVFGVIDGTLIAIVSPPIHSRDYPARLYRTRKGFTGINVVVISSSDSSFCYVNAHYPGCVHDSAIFKTSLARLQLLEEYRASGQNRGILLADQGFAIEPWIFPPIPGQNLSTEEQSFNRFHKLVRMGVENSIVDLKNIFRCLLKDRVLHYEPSLASNIVYACATLHNIRIKHRVLPVAEYAVNSDDESDESAAEISDSESEDGEASIDLPVVNDNRNRRLHPGDLFTETGNRKRQQYIRNHFYNR